MVNSKRLRVGVIGCGGIAQMMHLPFLFAMPERFEIAALQPQGLGGEAMTSPLDENQQPGETR